MIFLVAVIPCNRLLMIVAIPPSNRSTGGADSFAGASCCVLGRECDCADVEAQPCVAVLIGRYLEAIRWGVLTDHADGGPGLWMAIGSAEKDLTITLRAWRFARSAM